MMAAQKIDCDLRRASHHYLVSTAKTSKPGLRRIKLERLVRSAVEVKSERAVGRNVTSRSKVFQDSFAQEVIRQLPRKVFAVWAKKRHSLTSLLNHGLDIRPSSLLVVPSKFIPFQCERDHPACQGLPNDLVTWHIYDFVAHLRIPRLKGYLMRQSFCLRPSH